jgi:hypothetical protein
MLGLHRQNISTPQEFIKFLGKHLGPRLKKLQKHLDTIAKDDALI